MQTPQIWFTPTLWGFRYCCDFLSFAARLDEKAKNDNEIVYVMFYNINIVFSKK